MKRLTIMVALAAVLVVSGCGKTNMVTMPDGAVVSETTYVALKSQENKQETQKENMAYLMGGVQECQENDTDCQHSNQLWLVQVPWIAQSMDEGGVDPGYWSLTNAREERSDSVRYVKATADVLQTMCITGIAPWSCAAYGAVSGGTRIGGKGSDFRGSKWTVATDGSVVAQDEAVAANRKSSVAMDEGMAATDDGKIIDGEGNTQADVVSRPNTQNDLDFAGDGGSGDDSPGAAGDNNIDSEGLGFDGSL